MTQNPLHDIARWRSRPGPSGIPSVCSAHPLVIEAAMRAVGPTALPLLVEATCNQVNQDGGYTGMTPADFIAFVRRIADEVGFAPARLIFGGDHLGPNPWKGLPAAEAMEKAEAMIRAFAAAGFTKLHLDCSMGCKGEAVALGDAETAARAARLAAAAEALLPGGDVPPPVYIIGTEVPIPGGAMEEIGELAVTRPTDALETVAVARRAFAAQGLDAAFARVVAVVVQPGVEFGNHNVIDYLPEKAADLSAVLNDLPGLVFEAHSTDYQTVAGLSALVRDGFSILKVGPGLTFALREALYGLDAIAGELFPGRARGLRAVMEALMTAHPASWESYYHGTDAERAVMRHFSYSDRIRYYWPQPDAEAAVTELLALLEGVELPEPLIGQYLGGLYAAVRARRIAPHARTLLLGAVEAALAPYLIACDAG